MNRHSVVPTVIRDGTGGFSRLAEGPAAPEERLVNLFIEPDSGPGNFFTIRVQGHPAWFSPAENWMAKLPLDRDALWGAVRTCQHAWRSLAVDYEVDDVPLLQRSWDLREHPDLCERLLSQLAVKGAMLFEQLFIPTGPARSDKCNTKRLERIVEALRNLTDAESGWIRVTSDEYFAPWNLIYAKSLSDRANGSDAEPDGFWGFRHLVEHSPLEGGNPGKKVIFEEPLQIGVQLDETIDKTLNVACNAPVLETLNAYGESVLRIETRNSKPTLTTALGRVPLLDHILYFCCHAQAERDGAELPFKDSFLMLTDQLEITTAEIEFLLGVKDFERQPIVFLNACETAHMNSPFYQGFAKTFLGKRASSVIGTTSEIPAVFAGEFARRFFTELFEGEGDEGSDPNAQRRRVGDILLRLRRSFLDEHHNPLGMLYSLYHGADVSLPQRLAR